MGAITFGNSKTYLIIGVYIIHIYITIRLSRIQVPKKYNNSLSSETVFVLKFFMMGMKKSKFYADCVHVSLK